MSATSSVVVAAGNPEPTFLEAETLRPAAAVPVATVTVFVPPIAAIAADICVVGWIGISPWRLGTQPEPEPTFALASRARPSAAAFIVAPIGAIKGENTGSSWRSLSASPSDITLSWLIAAIALGSALPKLQKKTMPKGGVKKKGYNLVINGLLCERCQAERKTK